MRLLYNFGFLAGFCLMAPYYFWRLWRRGNWVAGFGQRFGDYDKNLRQALTNRHVVWLHAVSVGEVNVCIELVRALQLAAPNAKLVVSTTTTTGMAELQKKLPGTVSKIYYPIDRRKYVDWAFRAIHPSAVILVETEVWPNFVWRAYDGGTPLFLVNARLSERSYSRYRRAGFLFRRLFPCFTGVAAQTETYARQFRELGCSPEAVRVTGNIKFDAVRPAAKSLDVEALLRQIGVPADAQVLVAGSTHAGEEEILAKMCARLRTRFPRLFPVVVPRHFERAKDAFKSVEKHLKVVLRSEIGPNTQRPPGSVECLLVNTTGELLSFYEYAAVAFVGKSLGARGGQNPIEPAALGVPAVFGPNMQNFADVARILVSDGGAIQVRNSAELEEAVAKLLQDEGHRQRVGRQALETVKRNQGTVARTLEMILPHLARRGFYLAQPEYLEPKPAPVIPPLARTGSVPQPA